MSATGVDSLNFAGSAPVALPDNWPIYLSTCGKFILFSNFFPFSG